MYSFWFIFTGFWFIFTENFSVVKHIFRADGDCLAAAESVFAYGNDESPAEIRVRIVKELILNADCCTNDRNLKKGLNSARRDGHTKKAFATYSDECVPGNMLTDDTI